MYLFHASCGLKKVCESFDSRECTFFILFLAWKRYVKNFTAQSVPFQCRFQPQKETDCFGKEMRTFYQLFSRTKRYRQLWKMNGVPFSNEISLQKILVNASLMRQSSEWRRKEAGRAGILKMIWRRTCWQLLRWSRFQNDLRAFWQGLPFSLDDNEGHGEKCVLPALPAVINFHTE